MLKLKTAITVSLRLCIVYAICTSSANARTRHHRTAMPCVSVTPHLGESALFKHQQLYRQNDNILKIIFTPTVKRSGITHWEVYIGEPSQFLNTAHQENINMGESISICSEREYLHALDSKLEIFQHSHPDAQIDDMIVGTYTIKELWYEIRAELKIELFRTPGKKVSMHNSAMDDLNEPPKAAWVAPTRVLKRSNTVIATKHIFLKHGIYITNVNLSNQIWFKEKWNGHKWSEISTLPDLGISVPGAVQFVLRP